jgi:hypothetical protein
MVYMRPQCSDCKHRFREKGPYRCAAFPDGVPEAVLVGRHDHREPYPGDHGILFELSPAAKRKQSKSRKGGSAS